MTIYGTELALWVGVFACGGYFNLMPWVRRGISVRRRRRQMEENEGAGEARGNQDVALHDFPSSTSVFRTPSSVLVERGSGRVAR